MGRLFAAIAVAAVLVSSALAQSTDTSVGSGNIAQQPVSNCLRCGYASSRLMATTLRP
jgi:hypothetical protein